MMASPAEAARLNMVESQLRTNRVADQAVLDAFLAVPREAFVPERLRNVAHVDEDLPLGSGRWLMEPMVLGRLIQLAGIAPTETVLEIGAATGYGTAVLAALARSVVAVESDAGLARTAADNLARLGIANAVVRHGPLERGYPDRAPYDVVLFEGAVAEIPAAVADQLAEGGRLLAVVKPGAGVGHATLATKLRGTIAHRVVFDAGTPLLPGFAPKPSFVF
jgi:protein-L-isoaspartate(D-aspartate) O-methyltransferase